MEVFNLSNECKIDKNIPKEVIYKNAEANEKLKRIFIDKGVLNGVNLDNEIKSLEINSF